MEELGRIGRSSGTACYLVFENEVGKLQEHFNGFVTAEEMEAFRCIKIQSTEKSSRGKRFFYDCTLRCETNEGRHELQYQRLLRQEVFIANFKCLSEVRLFIWLCLYK